MCIRDSIDHRANNFKCTGPWKVYGDEGKARSLFAKYKKCTAVSYTHLDVYKRQDEHTVAGKVALRAGIDVLQPKSRQAVFMQ